ncbi:MAG: recombinase family protein [Flavobacteriaceae bacterium]|nr:recombinase family protein [Flavobacteriaceae bacterium]
MKIKYNRTSTYQQEGKRFDLDKETYDLTLFDQGVSGAIPFKERPQAARLWQLVQEKKVTEVVVDDLSRLGRNTADVLQTLHYLETNQINIVVKELGIPSRKPDGSQNPIWKMIVSVMASVYELERETIAERIRQGREAYQQRGGKLGRHFGSVESRETFLKKPKTQKILSLLQKGKSYRDISGRLGVSLATVTKVNKYVN